MKIYPIKFHPIVREKVWGGNRLHTVLNKPSVFENAGESWEISGVANQISVVSNGVYKNSLLTVLVEQFQERFLGKSVYRTYKNQFPLLFKFIDARLALSVQLHPDDTVAQQRHNSLGKTEMWYVLHAEKEATLIVGLKKPINRANYKEHLRNGTLEGVLQYRKVKAGDVFYISPGRVHAIGGGVLLAEIQQSSDITYRIYDWNRPGIDGKMRELHTDLALDAIDFEAEDDAKIGYDRTKETTLITNRYFSTTFLPISGKIRRNVKNIDSFVVYMCVEGIGFISAGGFSESFQTGDSVLVPAITKTVEINMNSGKLLEVFVPTGGKTKTAFNKNLSCL